MDQLPKQEAAHIIANNTAKHVYFAYKFSQCIEADPELDEVSKYIETVLVPSGIKRHQMFSEGEYSHLIFDVISDAGRQIPCDTLFTFLDWKKRGGEAAVAFNLPMVKMVKLT